MPRRTWILALTCTAAVLTTPCVTFAQDCTSDADCNPGQVCLDDGSDRYCERAPCGSAAECPMGFACEAWGGGTADCPPGAECPQPAVEMTCAPQEIPCVADADCPAGLVCVQDDTDSSEECAISSDGEVLCTSDDAGPSTRACAFAPVECESNADCVQVGFECMLFAERERCDDDQAVPLCAPGEPCEPAPASESQCVTETLRVCFPSRRDCTTDAQCAADWACLPLPDDDEDVPAAFVGAQAVCVPEGIKLVATEQIDTPSVRLGSDSDDSGFGSAMSAGVQSEDRAAAPTEAGSDGGLCSTAPGRARSYPGWLFGLSLVSIGWLRRRSRR